LMAMRNRIRNLATGNVVGARVVLLAVSLAFVGAFVVDQYGLARDAVRFICISCLGLSG
jgi:hypothetical protein